MSKITLVPRPQEANILMYCNYARSNEWENRCLVCKEDCKHQGEKTVFNSREEMKRYFSVNS